MVTSQTMLPLFSLLLLLNEWLITIISGEKHHFFHPSILIIYQYPFFQEKELKEVNKVQKVLAPFQRCSKGRGKFQEWIHFTTKPTDPSAELLLLFFFFKWLCLFSITRTWVHNVLCGSWRMNLESEPQLEGRASGQITRRLVNIQNRVQWIHSTAEKPKSEF